MQYILPIPDTGLGLRSEVFDTTFFDTDTILILSRSEKSIPIRYWYYTSLKFWYRYWYWYHEALKFDTDTDTDTHAKRTDTSIDTNFLVEIANYLIKSNENSHFYCILRSERGCNLECVCVCVFDFYVRFMKDSFYSVEMIWFTGT